MVVLEGRAAAELEASGGGNVQRIGRSECGKKRRRAAAFLAMDETRVWGASGVDCPLWGWRTRGLRGRKLMNGWSMVFGLL